MKIHEYQALALFQEYGGPVPKGKPAFSPDEAFDAAQTVGEGPYAVKAQIHSGGRGKAGGVCFAETPDEVRACAERLLGWRAERNIDDMCRDGWNFAKHRYN